MICKSCGHPNASNSLKCASCGSELDNERMKMFQAQAQFSKGVAVSLADTQTVEPTQEAPENADDFFAQVSAPKVAPPPPAVRKHLSKEAPAQSFFSQVGAVEEPAFETEIGSLRGEDAPKGPPVHPVYSPPTNPIIEAYIARRAAIRKT